MKPTLYQRLDFAVWRRIHQMPRFVVEWWQKRELKKIIAIAYEFVILYKKIYKKNKIEPQKIRNLADFEKIPVISKRIFRQSPVKDWTHCKWPDFQKYEWHQTSGSIGEPFKFPVSRDSDLFNRFGSTQYATYYSSRYLLWQGFSLNYFNKIRIVKILDKDPHDKFLYIPLGHLREKPLDVLSKISEYRPQFIYGRTSTLVELGRLIEKFRSSIRFPYAYAHGEKLTREQRTYLKKVVGCETYNVYGLEEVGEVAVECELHNGLHIYEESCIIEILDNNNKRLADGKTGRIVITHFFNYIMPMIRYDTIDYGYILREKCGCGLNNPRLFVKSRDYSPVFINSKKIMPMEIQTIMEEFPDYVLRFQVAKISWDTLEIRIVPTLNFDPKYISEIQNTFFKRLGLKIMIKVVEYIPLVSSGKTRLFIDETIKS